MRIDFDATPYSAQAFKILSMSISYPGRRVSWRPIMWPIIVVWEFSMALKILSVCSFLDILKRL
jgi:hypothetical protein